MLILNYWGTAELNSPILSIFNIEFTPPPTHTNNNSNKSSSISPKINTPHIHNLHMLHYTCTNSSSGETISRPFPHSSKSGGKLARTKSAFLFEMLNTRMLRPWWCSPWQKNIMLLVPQMYSTLVTAVGSGGLPQFSKQNKIVFTP